MEELEKFVRDIKSAYPVERLKIIKFLYETNILDYTQLTEKFLDNGKEVERPTGILEFSYIKLCDKKFDNIDNMLERIFLAYINYGMREYKTSWRLNLNNLAQSLNSKCSYCNVDTKECPLKLLTYIKKCIKDNKFDSNKTFKLLVEEPEKTYQNEYREINLLAKEISSLSENKIDFVAAKMILASDMIKVTSYTDTYLAYKYIDLKIKNNSFFNNLNEFYIQEGGIDGNLYVDKLQISDSNSYIFTKSPIEIAAYIRYLSITKNISEEMLIQKILEIKRYSEADSKMAYYNQYVKLINDLKCDENAKKEILGMLNYIKNFDNIYSLPYIHFNTAIYTTNDSVSYEIINHIIRFARTLYYIDNKPTLWVDCELLVKKTKDSLDMITQVENMFAKNDAIIFEKIEKIRTLNEYRVESLFSTIERCSIKNRRTMVFFLETEEGLKGALKRNPYFEEKIINKKIYINNLNSEQIKNKIVEKLRYVAEVDTKFEEELEEYVKQTFYPKKETENEYIEKTYNEIIYGKYKELNPINKFDKKDIVQTDESRSIEEIMNDINKMVGLTEVKTKVNELIKYLEYRKKANLETSLNLNMIFKGNAGTGKTTIARLLVELFYKLGFIKENKLIEVTSKDLIGSHLGETAPKTQETIMTAIGGVLFIDEANTIMASKGGGSSNYPAECISTINKALETYKDNLIVIFAGNTKEMNEFLNESQGLASRIGYEIEFSDFSKEELLQIFENTAIESGFTVEKDAIEKIELYIQKNKIGRNFGNARYVKNLLNQLIIVHAANCKDDNLLKVITKKDIQILEETKKDKVRTVDEILKELNSLIGLEKVKETITGFVSIVELYKKLDRTEDFNMHMIFKGNAGTGKTTVARLLAEIYYNLGYIKKNKLVEVQSQDLIGEFLGQTGPKTQAIIDSALDGVLFIDEAYSIMEHSGTNASYSAECIATLLKAMEDYKGRLIIIFAGYTEEMRRFRDMNPGLKSRVGYEINFDDYSVEELMQIFEKKVADKKFKVSSKAKEKVEKILRKAKEVANFGNGRFVENTVQKIIIQHAINVRNELDEERLITFEEEDIKDIKAEESKNKIGF